MTHERGPAEAGPLSAYLDGLDEPVRSALGAIVDRARALVPDADEGTSYGMAALRHRGRALLSVRETKTQLSLYPFSREVVAQAAGDLEGFAISPGAIGFSLAQPLPDAIIDRIVLARRDEIDGALDR